MRFFGLSSEVMRFRSGDAAQFDIVRGDMRYGFIELAWFGGSGHERHGKPHFDKTVCTLGHRAPFDRMGKRGDLSNPPSIITRRAAVSVFVSVIIALMFVGGVELYFLR